MKIAIIDDYIKFGGAIQVVASLHELFPQAPIYTIFSQAKSDPLLKEQFKDAKIIESWFVRLPYSERLISPLRFLIPLIWRSFNFSEFDLIITSASWAITKGLAKGKTKEICYCHTPPRYLYGYDTSRDWKKHWYIRAYALIVNHFMRMYDFNKSQKVTWFIANSMEVQKRINKFYRRESIVINPPVETPNFKLGNKIENYYLTGGRLEKAKNFDLIIKACNQLKVPLKIYGTGVQEGNLRQIAGETIKFLGSITNEQKFEMMSRCKAFIVAAADEDFGITPVEAMASGRPVLAYRGGGYLETVVGGKTGEFFSDYSVDGLVKALKTFKSEKYKSEDCRRQAQKFSKENFKKKIKDFIKQNYA